MIPIPYDFRNPVKLAPPRQKLLHGWLQSSAALAGRKWAKQLPVALELSFVLLEDSYAQGALAALPADSVGQHILLGEVPTMLIQPRSLRLNLASMMLGEEQAQADRELTVVEEELADYFLESHWLAYFREAWPGPAACVWQLQQREAQPNYSRLFAAGEVLAVWHWQLLGPFGEAKGQWLFPRHAVVQLLTGAQENVAPAEAEKEAAIRKNQIVRNLPLSIECILGTAQLKLSELSRLQVGDVVLLDQKAGEHVPALVANMPMFRGLPGRNGSWKAFRIEAIIEK